MGLFGKTAPVDPRKKGREMSAAIRKEQRLLQREITKIKREEDKVALSLKKAAKSGEREACTILAKEIINSKKAVNRIHTSVAQLKSVEYQIQNQMAMVKVAGAFEKSTQVMQAMQQLVKVTEVRDNMMNLSKEMTRMGIMEELMTDTMDSVLDADEDEEDAAQDEIDKVLFELTAGQLGKLPETESKPMPAVVAKEVAKPSTSQLSDEEDSDEEMMEKRLQALRS